MSLSVSQMIAVSYNDVSNEMRTPENQWVENAFMRELERQGAIERENGAPVYESTLDYKRNPGAGFQSGDLDQVSTSKTDVLTAAQFTSAQLQVPIVWSKKDEAENSTPNQKVSLVKSLLTNAINSHDDVIEEALFIADTDGFKGLPSIVPDNGQGTVGGIDASLEAWWRNYTDSYDQSNYSDLVAKMTIAFDTIAKGSGSTLAPKFLVGDSEIHSAYEGTQQGLVRYVDTREADAGFKILAFKTARFSYSQYATDSIYFLNPKAFKLMFVKQAYRLLGDTTEFIDAAGYIRKVFTLAQCKTGNKSRLGVLTKGF